MNCTNCGNPLAESAKFCNKCGTPVAAAPAVNSPEDFERTVSILDDEPIPAQVPAYSAPEPQPAYQAPQPVAQPTYQAPQPVAQPTYQAPQYQAPAGAAPYASVSNEPKEKKSKFIRNIAPKEVKSKAVVGTVLSVILALLLVCNIAMTLMLPVYNIPFVSLALSAEGTDVDAQQLDEEIDELLEEYEDEKEEMEQSIEDARDDGMPKKEIKAAEELVELTDEMVDNFADFGKNPSLMNLYTLYNNVLRLEDEIVDSDGYDLIEKYDPDGMVDLEESIDDFDDGLEDVRDVMFILFAAVIGMWAFGFLFALFGIIFRQTALIVAGSIFSFFYAIALSNVFTALLTLVLGIVLAVFTAKVNSAYKQYKRS